MKNPCLLSDVAKNYLCEFYSILDRMTERMTSAELSDSISHNFIVQMIPHHQAAIEMSENILKYTTNVPLQNIASQIVKEQTKSIENMQRIECACSELKNCERDLCLYNRKTEQIMCTMFNNMKDAHSSNRINCNFMFEMIPHHKGAVEMSKNALQYELCPELKSVLNSIIQSQEMGIKQMQNLLRCLGC